MFRRSILAGLFLVLAAMFTFVGCSDDANPNNSNVGDPNSPEFQQMKAAITTAVDSTLGTSMKFAYKPNRFPTDLGWDDGPVLGPTDSLLYNYNGGWHILYLGLTASVDYSFTFVDSARFLEGSNVAQFFRSRACTGLDLIHHQSSAYNGTDDDYTDLQSYADLSFRNRLEPNPYFYGHVNHTIDHYYEVGGEQKQISYEFDLVANDVTYEVDYSSEWQNSNVTGGELIISVIVDNGTDSIEWDINIEFNESGQAMVEASNGEKTYSFTITPQYQ